MARAPHARHRWRIASRCIACGASVLYACSYRTCAATRTLPRHGCFRTRRRTASVDLVKEAYRIFGKDIAPAREIGL